MDNDLTFRSCAPDGSISVMSRQTTSHPRVPPLCAGRWKFLDPRRLQFQGCGCPPFRYFLRKISSTFTWHCPSSHSSSLTVEILDLNSESENGFWCAGVSSEALVGLTSVGRTRLSTEGVCLFTTKIHRVDKALRFSTKSVLSTTYRSLRL